MDHGKQDKAELNMDELGIVAGGLPVGARIGRRFLLVFYR